MITGNNPGNIRRVQGQTWQGEIVPSPWVPGFCTFATLADGFRALLKLLTNYINAGYNTIEKIITRWAPPTENDTPAYILFITNYTGIPGNALVPATPGNALLLKIAAGIAENEHSGSLTASDYAALQQGAQMLTGSPSQSQYASLGGWIAALLALLGILGMKKKRG